ncbi:dihydroxyacetone kinase phosphoryl donor subunit DhaM [Catenulispora pinisilvae]|uniref:dihydroxyacetone kinase phosphoryl donor subunit DhaM n=1 Tax=Catenulispora pinisilvae TaxID=2705253 RepID=UPI0018925E87|nr:dihydroxyacetone kinase phosphoryl donor subunit DhaM [Catenulispora pinisilvae]
MNQSIGIVLVSHSAQLATGLRELLAQVGSDRVPVAVAGGTEDGGLGTSYDRIVAAIAEADQGAGVIVLPDLGSSVLTTLAVLEDYPRADVLLVDAPFVEGAVAAAVTAATGADLAAVAEAARQARDMVKVQGDAPAAPPTPESTPLAETEPRPDSVSVAVTLPATLHARPAGRLAVEAAKFASAIRLEYGGKSVSPTGMLTVMSLSAKIGGTMTVYAEGLDADAAVASLAAILAEME